MLIEKLETNGIHVISANTDGILCLFSNKLMDSYKRICSNWEIQVGNSSMGNLEFTQYSFMVQTSVNDYLAVKLDGVSKCKGDFVTNFELHKNKSGRIIPLALNEYFIKNTSPEVFIRSHENIYDFCFGVKAKGEGKLVLFDDKTSSTSPLQKINRYFVSNTGHQMYKQLPKLEDKKISRQLDIFGNVSDGTRNISIQAGYKSTILNNVSSKLAKDYDISYEFYILKVKNIINSIENKEDTNDKL